MLLMDLLSEEVIAPHLESDSRDGILGELIDLLVRAGSLPAEARGRALAAVVTREERQSTGLGSGVAIPHGTCSDVDEVVAALGIHPTGVDFAAIDDAPVRLVILLLVPPNLLQAHIRTLAGIARVLNDSALREQLIASDCAQTLIDLLIEREEAS
jgi:mannitol/fructose-specific phosphotransferase system IIA component (Ntr-type)